MILPIVAYGHPVLRQRATEISPEFDGLQQLISDMWETLYASHGVGLAAPQINQSVRLFLVDTTQLFENMDSHEKKNYPDAPGYKGVFINPSLLSLDGKPWAYNEGCLSIPGIREDIFRNEAVELRFQDETFKEQKQIFHGLTARVILHEYDHLEGKLFIDYITPLKRKLIKSRLNDIAKGKVQVDYKMIFSKKY
ncbi:MAG: peptide deformylase [Chitinophagaceae bacterium]|nr:peptide deformylase [Chitinophagaceae bacterium]